MPLGGDSPGYGGQLPNTTPGTAPAPGRGIRPAWARRHTNRWARVQASKQLKAGYLFWDAAAGKL